MGQIRLAKDARVLPFLISTEVEISQHRVSKPFGFALDFDPAAGTDRRIYYFNAGNYATLCLWRDALVRATARVQSVEDTRQLFRNRLHRRLARQCPVSSL